MSTSTLSVWISWVAIWLACVGSLWGSTYVTWIVCPLTPPAALICWTARSVPRCMPAAMGALVPLASASYPILIGVPVAGPDWAAGALAPPDAGAGALVAAGAALGGVLQAVSQAATSSKT